MSTTDGIVLSLKITNLFYNKNLAIIGLKSIHSLMTVY